MRKILSTLVLLFTGFASSHAQTSPAGENRPNLSGRWTLNIATSDYGQLPTPANAREDITQTGDTLKFVHISETSYGQQNYAFNVVADGTEQLMPEGSFPAEAPFKILSSKAEWHGPALTLFQKTSYQGAPGTLTATYTLSPDGNVLTRITQLSLPMGEFDTKAHFDKQ
jgi:hypothetical protein